MPSPTRVLARPSAHVLAILLAGGVATSCAKPADVARAHAKRGDAYVAARKLNEAIIEYRRAIQELPQWGEVRYKLAEAYVQNHEPGEAYGEYVRAADLMPTNIEAQLKAGQALLRTTRFQDARTRADAVLALDPTNAGAVILRGAALAGLNDFDAALAQIEEAIAVSPDRSGMYDDLGALQLAKGNARAAEDAFLKAVRLDDRSVQARLMLAVFYLSTRRLADAEDAFKRALEIDPSNAAANRALAIVYLASHRRADAEPHLQAFARISPTPGSHLALADYYASLNRPDDALRILNAIRPEDGKAFAAAQSRVAAIAFARGQKADAYARLDDLLRRQPTFIAGRVVKAQFLMSEHRAAEALPLLTDAVASEPSSAQVHFQLGRVYAALGRFDEATRAFGDVLKLNPRAAAASVELARVQLATGRAAASVQSARQALASQPGDSDAHLLLARGLIAAHELAPAQRELEALLTRHPTVAAVHSELGNLSFARGDRASARRSFERALALDRASVDAIAGLTRLDLTDRNVAAARSRAQAIVATAPSNSRLLLLAGETFFATGDQDRAEDTLRRVIDVDPANFRAFAMLSQMLISAKKLDSARAQFDALARRSAGTSTEIGARTMVALILESQDRLADAQRCYEEIVAAFPGATVAANNLAWLYAEHGGNLNVALALAQSAVQRAPDQPEINDTLGWIYYKKELPTQSIAALEHSVKLDAANPLFHYHLGLAYSKIDDRPRAKQSLERALQLNPVFDGSADARKVLASLTR